MRYSRNTKNITFGVLALLVSVVAIGMVYAGFTQTLNINGTGNVVASKWDIYFANLANAVTTGTANLVTPASIQSKTTIGDYSVTFATPGDSLTYTFDITNQGDFDATLTGLTKGTPSCTPVGTSATNVCKNITYILKYTVNGAPVAENDTLLKGETKNMTLKLVYNSNTPANELPSEQITVGNLGITLLYGQSSGYNGINSTARGWRYINRQNANQITIGDEVAIEDEHFYVINPDDGEGNTVLFAKYNLLVGDVFDVIWNGNVQESISLNKSLNPNNIEGYGLQNSIARGLVVGANQYIGVVAFSGKAYWDDGECIWIGPLGKDVSCLESSGLKSKYANESNIAGKTGRYSETYPNIYESTMSNIAPQYSCNDSGCYAQDNGYTIAYYVEEYINTLKTLGASEDIKGRLILYEEAASLRSTLEDIIFYSAYWSGSAIHTLSPLGPKTNHMYSGVYFSSSSNKGVRPVIEVPTSEI